MLGYNQVLPCCSTGFRFGGDIKVAFQVTLARFVCGSSASVLRMAVLVLTAADSPKLSKKNHALITNAPKPVDGSLIFV